jgi:hypothetical protein
VTLELGALSVRHLSSVSVNEEAALVHHRLPGADGDVVQVLGRPSVRVRFQGSVYGPEAAADLQQLRSAFLSREPLDFYTEAVGEGYFAEVLVARLDVTQRAEHPWQFDFHCEVVEYVEPPEPPVDPLAALDAPLRAEAAAFIDNVQNSLDEVARLTGLMTGTPDFAVPTPRLDQSVTAFTALTGRAASELDVVRDVLDEGVPGSD